MTNLSEQVFYIGANRLAEAITSGNWTFCRPEFYIRQGIDEDSIADKQQALTFITDSANRVGTFRVLEPLAVNKYAGEDGRTIHEIVSGNTRVRAILAQLAKNPCSVRFGLDEDSYEISIEKFENIPYRIFDAPIEITEAVNFQLSTNDHTKQHNPLDLAIKISELKPIIETQFKSQYPTMKSRDLQGKVTDYLCQLFSRTRSNLSQMAIVINKGSDQLRRLVRNSNMSFDTAHSLLQKCGKDTKQSDTILQKLITQAKLQLTPEQDPESFKIFKSHVLQYFEDLERKAIAEKKAAINKEKEAEENYEEEEEDVVPKVENSETFQDESDMPPTIDKAELSKAKLPVLRDAFLEDIEQLQSRITFVRLEDITYDHAREVDEVNTAMLEFLLKANDLYPVNSRTVALYPIIRDAYLARLADIEALCKSKEERKDTDYFLEYKLLAKVAKPAENLRRSLYEPKKAAAEIIEIGTEHETVEIPY